MMSALAIHGGRPVFDHMVGYGRQDVDESDIEAVVSTLRGDFLTCGPATERFEAALCEVTGAAHVTAVSTI